MNYVIIYYYYDTQAMCIKPLFLAHRRQATLGPRPAPLSYAFLCKALLRLELF